MHLFYLKQKKMREKQETRDRERLAKLRAVMEEQAKKDKQRSILCYLMTSLCNGKWSLNVYRLKVFTQYFVKARIFSSTLAARDIHSYESGHS